MSNIQKNFIIDTNVLLFDPDSITKLDNNNVIIPDIVIEELDHFKSEQNDRGRNSRKVSRFLDSLAAKGNLTDGVSLGENKGKLTVYFTNDINSKSELANKFQYDLNIYDNRILFLCSKTKDSILITKDVNLRVKANTLSIKAQDYRNDKIINNKEEGYTGRDKALLTSKDLKTFHDTGKIDIDNLLDINGNKYDINKLIINEFFELRSADTNSTSPLLGRFDGKHIVKLQYDNNSISGITPRNVGQRFMAECLMQSPKDAPLVVIKGIAGTAKTLFALAAGMEGYKSNKLNYHKLLICRPSVTMDEDIGFLPGGENEKIAPYMRAIKDNLFLILSKGKDISSPHQYHQIEEEVENTLLEEYVKTEALAYQRGRSLNNYYFLLDEMQNSTLRQAKDVVTRCGIDTKVVLLGDPDQIDSPYLDSFSNGLTFTSECMKGSPLCWQVTLTEDECERSSLAKEAAIRMKGK